jgi:sugar lactone lactonase YvrE
MKTVFKIKHTLAYAGLAFLTACGGGGNGESSSNNTSAIANTLPSATAQSHIIDEDVNLALILSGTDSDGSIASYAVTTQPANGSLTGTGANLVYTPNLNFNGSDSLTFTVTDNDGAASNAVSIDITINPVSDAPVIALADSYDISENLSATGLLLNLYATDPELDNISISLGQEADSELFTIDSDTSELLFSTIPDFENPTDSDGDNSYQVSVIYTDSTDADASKLIEIHVTDKSNIQADMTFPTPNANLGGTTEVSLKGTFTDSEDNEVLPTDVSVFTVNNVEAILTNDNTSWFVTLPISEQEIELAFEIIRNSEVVSTSSHQLLNTAQPINFKRPFDGAFDEKNNRLLVLDTQYDALMALDLTTNEVSMLADKYNSSELNFLNPGRMAFDATNNLVFITDSFDDAIYEIDLATGVRRILSDEQAGSGTGLITPRGITYDASNDQLYLVDSGLDALVKLDVISGDRSVVSDNDIGLGDTINLPFDVALDIASNTAYVSDTYGTIFSIDLASGDRTVVSSLEVGAGVDLTEPRGLLLNASNTSLYVIDYVPEQPAVVEINLATLSRTLVSNENNGIGTDFELPIDIISDKQDEKVWALDLSVEGIISTDLTTGDRELLSDPNNTPNFTNLSAIAHDASNNRLLVIDEDSLYAVDISDTPSAGDITILADDKVGTGTSLLNPKKIALDESNNRIFTVIDNENNEEVLLSIDLITGERVVIAEFNTFRVSSEVTELAYEPANNRIFYIESNGMDTLVKIDLNSGEFSEVSNLFETAQEILNASISPISQFNLDIENNIIFVPIYPFGLIELDLISGTAKAAAYNDAEDYYDHWNVTTLDAKNNRILVVDAGASQVLSIDIASGTKTLISDTHSTINMRRVSDVTYDSEKNLLFFSDSIEDNIYVIDVETGERAYVTH